MGYTEHLWARKKRLAAERERGASRISATKEDGIASMERVPCPLDPTHTIFKNSMKKHLQICTAKQQRDRLEAEPYYCLDCNSGAMSSSGKREFDTDELEDTSNSYKKVDADKLLKKLEDCYATFSSDICCLPPNQDAVALTKEEEKVMRKWAVLSHRMTA